MIKPIQWADHSSEDGYSCSRGYLGTIFSFEIYPPYREQKKFVCEEGSGDFSQEMGSADSLQEAKDLCQRYAADAVNEVLE